jgi:hypothetical protein
MVAMGGWRGEAMADGSENGAGGDSMAAGDRMVIDCDECVMQGTSTCDDCIVTFVCDRASDEPVVVGVEEVRAVRLLENAGLVPALRLVRRAG